ncbi:MAG TPA: hypothetical protein VFQ49_15260, partial [Actinomycetes bacterium]|nr:hypothetical protein [Actinomycetes bacterium]
MASRPPTITIDESDFPALYHAADRSQDGRARGGGLDAGRDPHREAGDVGLDLAPQGALGAA